MINAELDSFYTSKQKEQNQVEFQNSGPDNTAQYTSNHGNWN